MSTTINRATNSLRITKGGRTWKLVRTNDGSEPRQNERIYTFSDEAWNYVSFGTPTEDHPDGFVYVENIDPNWHDFSITKEPREFGMKVVEVTGPVSYALRDEESGKYIKAGDCMIDAYGDRYEVVSWKPAAFGNDGLVTCIKKDFETYGEVHTFHASTLGGIIVAGPATDVVDEEEMVQAPEPLFTVSMTSEQWRTIERAAASRIKELKSTIQELSDWSHNENRAGIECAERLVREIRVAVALVGDQIADLQANASADMAMKAAAQ